METEQASTPRQQRFLEAISKLNLDFPVAEIARKTGYAPGTISPNLKPEGKASPKFIRKIAEIYKLDAEQILFGNTALPSIDATSTSHKYGSDIMLPHGPGERFLSGENEMEDMGNGLFRLHTLLVDKKSAAGYLTGWGDQEYLGELKRHTVTINNPVRGVYRSFQINDNNDSMHDPDNPLPNGIAPRDIVTGRLLLRSHWKNKLHYKKFPFWTIIHKTEGITTKQIIDHNVEAGIIMCHSLNPDRDRFPDFPLFLDDVIQLFNVVKVEKNY